MKPPCPSCISALEAGTITRDMVLPAGDLAEECIDCQRAYQPHASGPIGQAAGHYTGDSARLALGRERLRVRALRAWMETDAQYAARLASHVRWAEAATIYFHAQELAVLGPRATTRAGRGPEAEEDEE